MKEKLWCFVLGVLLMGVACDQEPPPPRRSAPGENPWQQSIVRPSSPGLSMVERLRMISERVNPEKNPYLSEQRIEIHRRALERAVGFKEQSYFHQEYAKDLLNAGRSEAGLQAFRAMEAYLKEANPDFLNKHRVWMLRKLAICHLRIGEQENCIANHHRHSCLFPIPPHGVHQLTRGSEGAIEALQAILALDPESREARWLLNIAYMTLGRYPEEVPPADLIDPRVFESDYEIPTFPDVAPELGVDVAGLSGGSVMEDFNGDGLLDLMCSGLGLEEPLRCFLNRGTGGFEEVTEGAGLKGLFGGLNLVSTDYNNDGRIDVFVLRGGWFGVQGHHPNSLLKNKGDGTFEEVTEEAGLLSLHPTQTAVWFDFDSDGWVDLFIGNESSHNDPHPSELYRNNGDGTFTEAAARCSLSVRAMVKGVTAGDYNNDGRPDLFLSCGGQPNRLFRNDGPIDLSGTGASGWHFTEVAQEAGVVQPIWSFPTWFWDYDNDGWMDLFVSDYRMNDPGDLLRDYLGEPHASETARLYRNRGDGTFEDVSREQGLQRILFGMGANYGDLDHDGYLDFYVGTGDPDLGKLMPNRMFRNDRGQGFQDVTTAGGFGHLQKGHGVSFGDIDNDGDTDLYQDMGGAYSGDTYQNVLYLNPGFDHHYVTLRLQGVRSNRAAIGARVRVVLADSEGGLREIHRTVSSGGSFGASPFQLQIGLGQAGAIHSIGVEWPGGRESRFEGPIEVDRAYQIVEQAPQLAPIELPRIDLEGLLQGGGAEAGSGAAPSHAH